MNHAEIRKLQPLHEDFATWKKAIVPLSKAINAYLCWKRFHKLQLLYDLICQGSQQHQHGRDWPKDELEKILAKVELIYCKQMARYK